MGIVKWFKGAVDSYNKSRLVTKEQRKYLNEVKPKYNKDELTHPYINTFNKEEQKRFKNILWLEFNLYWDISYISKEAFIKRYFELCKLVPVDYAMNFASLRNKAIVFHGDIPECYITHYKSEDVDFLINKLRSVNDTKPRDYDKMLRIISALNKVTGELRKTQKSN